jgi:hypothetical protein
MLLTGSVRPNFVPQLLTMDQWVQLVISYLYGYLLPSMSREDITHPRQSEGVDIHHKADTVAHFVAVLDDL